MTPCCETCGEPLDTDCVGQPRCDVCDPPCPHCYDGGGPDEEEDTCIVCRESWSEHEELESTYCGSIHPGECAAEHAKTCGVCASDFDDRGLTVPSDDGNEDYEDENDGEEEE